MNIYIIDYEVEFSGAVEIQADSKEEAEEQFNNIPWDELIGNASHLNEEVFVEH